MQAKSKRIIVILLIAIFICVSLIGISLAFFETNSKINGNITLGELDFCVIANTPTNLKVMPGSTVESGISVINSRNNEGTDISGLVNILLRINIINGEAEIEQINNSKFTKQGNTYYYNDVIKTGEVVEFFKTFTIKKELDNEYQNKPLNLNFKFEAIQSENLAYLTEWQDAPQSWLNLIAKKV